MCSWSKVPLCSSLIHHQWLWATHQKFIISWHYPPKSFPGFEKLRTISVLGKKQPHRMQSVIALIVNMMEHPLSRVKLRDKLLSPLHMFGSLIFWEVTYTDPKRDLNILPCEDKGTWDSLTEIQQHWYPLPGTQNCQKETETCLV